MQSVRLFLQGTQLNSDATGCQWSLSARLRLVVFASCCTGAFLVCSSALAQQSAPTTGPGESATRESESSESASSESPESARESLDRTADSTDLVDLIEARNWPAVSLRLEAALTEAELSKAQPDGMTALHWATFHGNAKLVQRLVRAGADVNAMTRYRVTPLSIACRHASAEIANILLEHDADHHFPLSGGETPLMTAARAGNAQIVSALIDRGAEVNATERAGQTALMWAAAEGHTPVVSVLLAAGADATLSVDSGFTALLFAAREGRLETAITLVEAGSDVDLAMKPDKTSGRAPRDSMSALMLAVESGHFELAVKLVELGADPSDQRSGFSALHAVSWVRKTNRGDDIYGDPPPRGSGKIESLTFVREMVSRGADVNLALNKGGGGRAKLSMRGVTPFLLAARTADLPLLKTLLDLGADPLATNIDGCNALMAAAGVGVTAVGEEAGTEPEVLETIEFLHDLGVDVNWVDQNGETAMHGAAYRNFPRVVARLAKLGADPQVWDQKNRYGWTPTLIAAGNRPGSFKPSPETLAALTNVGARPLPVGGSD